MAKLELLCCQEWQWKPLFFSHCGFTKTMKSVGRLGISVSKLHLSGSHKCSSKHRMSSSARDLLAAVGDSRSEWLSQLIVSVHLQHRGVFVDSKSLQRLYMIYLQLVYILLVLVNPVQLYSSLFLSITRFYCDSSSRCHDHGISPF